MCEWVSSPVCTSWVFLSQEEGVSVSLSDLNDGEGFFDGLIFLCMCGDLSMVAGLLLCFVPCVSSAVLGVVVEFVGVGEVFVGVEVVLVGLRLF